MLHHHVNRLPVLSNGVPVGMISRSNLLHAFIVLSKPAHSAPVSDATIREQIGAELAKQAWMTRSAVSVLVNNGIVGLEGTVLNPRQRTAARVAAENVPGVKEVRDCLTLSQAS